ncbi:hypothetical protein BX667DRAFT_504740 [Coemansia mojavensis]|nr:hypothetical protein BX667DRAFT_504740 [Coemansia mojavensis]
MRDIAATYYDNAKNVDIQFNYIGNLNSSHTYGVKCMHGDTETSPETTLQFILCQQTSVKRIGSYTLFAECLRPISNWLTVIQCAMSDEGKLLLQENIANASQNNITTSLTFSLNENKRCVFDSGHWVEPEEGCPGGNSVPSFSKSIQELN